jgi:hypothetical protein
VFHGCYQQEGQRMHDSMKPFGPVFDSIGGVTLNYDVQTALSRTERARTTWPIL